MPEEMPEEVPEDMPEEMLEEMPEEMLEEMPAEEVALGFGGAAQEAGDRVWRCVAGAAGGEQALDSQLVRDCFRDWICASSHLEA